MIFDGDILGGLNEMFGGLLGFLLDLPKKIFDKTVEYFITIGNSNGYRFHKLI